MIGKNIMANKTEFKLELLNHVDEISAEDLADVLTGTAETLNLIGIELSGDNTINHEWKIVNISMHSPFQASYIPVDKSQPEIAEATSREFFNIQKLIEEKAEFPPKFNDRIANSLHKTIRARKKISKGMRYASSNKQEFVSTERYDENIEILIRMINIEAYSEWTTLIGKLWEVGGKGITKNKHPHFNLYSKLYGKSIVCYFDEELFESIRADLQIDPIDVSISGKLHFNAKGVPLNVTEIMDYEKLPPINDIKECVVDITGNLSAEEHLYRVRYGE